MAHMMDSCWADAYLLTHFRASLYSDAYSGSDDVPELMKDTGKCQMPPEPGRKAFSSNKRRSVDKTHAVEVGLASLLC
jgi:hypothetical protein